MRKDWTYGILDDVAIKGSSNISLTKIKDDMGDYPVFGAKGFVKNVSFYQQESEYLGIIKDGAGIGRVTKHPGKSSILATMQYIIPKKGFDIQFIKYFLNNLDFERYRTGSTIPHIYYKDYKSEPFPLIKLPEQKRIVANLDQCFDAIDKARANVERNLQNAKDLFQSKLNEVFSQKGEGWVDKRLGDVCVITSSKRIYKNEYVNDGVPYYRSREIKELANNKSISIKLYIDRKKYIEIKNRFGVPKKGDVLITALGATIGEIYIVNSNDEFYFKDGNVLWLKDFESLNTSYLRYALISFIKKIISLAQGSAYNALTIEKLVKSKIPVPSSIIQNDIVKHLDELHRQTLSLESHYKQELDAMDELKKSILQKAFEGELS